MSASNSLKWLAQKTLTSPASSQSRSAFLATISASLRLEALKRERTCSFSARVSFTVSAADAGQIRKLAKGMTTAVTKEAENFNRRKRRLICTAVLSIHGCPDGK